MDAQVAVHLPVAHTVPGDMPGAEPRLDDDSAHDVDGAVGESNNKGDGSPRAADPAQRMSLGAREPATEAKKMFVATSRAGALQCCVHHGVLEALEGVPQGTYTCSACDADVEPCSDSAINSVGDNGAGAWWPSDHSGGCSSGMGSRALCPSLRGRGLHKVDVLG